MMAREFVEQIDEEEIREVFVAAPGKEVVADPGNLDKHPTSFAKHNPKINRTPTDERPYRRSLPERPADQHR